MSVTLIYSDDFESYPVGQTLPFGSWMGGSLGALAGGQVGTEVTTDSFGVSTGYGIGYGTSSRLFVLGALTYTNILGIFSDTTTYFKKLMNIGSDFTHPVLRLVVVDVLTGTGPELLEFGFSPSNKMFVNICGTHAGESLEALHYNNWYEFQVNASFSDVGGVVRGTAQVVVDGQMVLDGTLTSGRSTVGLPGVGVNRWAFQQATVSGSLIDDIALYNGTDTYSIAPGGHARVAQAAIEVVEGHALTRAVSTAFSTVTEGTSTTQARIAQAVIEILVKYDNNWSVYEA